MKLTIETPIKKTKQIGPILIWVGVIITVASPIDYFFFYDNIQWWLTLLGCIAVPVGMYLGLEVTHIQEIDFYFDEMSED